MAPVCLQGALPVDHPAHNGKGRVENGQAQNDKGHGKGDHRVKLEQALNGGHCKDIAQKHGACVAHEDLGRIHIIGQKADAGAGQRRHHQGDLRFGIHHCDDEHGDGGNGGNAAGQPVQPIDEIHRVGDADDPDHRHRDGKHAQMQIAAGGEGIGKALHHHAGKHGDQRRRDLPGEFDGGLQGDHIVHHAQRHQK